MGAGLVVISTCIADDDRNRLSNQRYWRNALSLSSSTEAGGITPRQVTDEPDKSGPTKGPKQAVGAPDPVELT